MVCGTWEGEIRLLRERIQLRSLSGPLSITMRADTVAGEIYIQLSHMIGQSLYLCVSQKRHRAEYQKAQSLTSLQSSLGASTSDDNDD